MASEKNRVVNSRFSAERRPYGAGRNFLILLLGLLTGFFVLSSSVDIRDLLEMRRVFTFLASLTSIGGSVFAQRCNPEIINSSPPGNAFLALQTYSYCGGKLQVTAYINNLVYNKVATLYYTNRQDRATPLTVLALNYHSPVPGTNNEWEYWTARESIWIDGITRFTNLTYIAVDSGSTFVDGLDLVVHASGAPEPSLPSPPKPYATPLGFSNDITDYLAVSPASEGEIAHTRMFLNINPGIGGAVNGTVVAAQSGPSYSQKLPDYEYNWVRDASLTMDVVRQLYAAATDAKARSEYETILFEYAGARATEQNDPNLQTGLGEPKFYLSNNVYGGQWGRPQNDGPATAAITLIEFADAYLANGGSIDTVKEMLYDSSAYPTSAPMQRDLLFVASSWMDASFDLWEEVEGNHFYTLMVQRRALVMGAKFATKVGDSETAQTLSAQIDALSARIDEFWDPNREILLYEYGPILGNKDSFLDTAVMLGIEHGYAADGFYSYTDDRVLSTAVRIATAFIDVYPIAKRQSGTGGKPLSPPVGRYPEDVFNGIKSKPSGGNPWYLCTATFAQFMYSVSAEYTAAKRISVTATSKPFFDYFAPAAKVGVGATYTSDSAKFQKVIDSLHGWGDAFLRTVKFYTPSNGHLTEEINRNTGVPQGAADLTWSYASVLSAAVARAELRGDSDYAKDLANLGVSGNS